MYNKFVDSLKSSVFSANFAIFLPLVITAASDKQARRRQTMFRIVKVRKSQDDHQ